MFSLSAISTSSEQGFLWQSSWKQMLFITFFYVSFQPCKHGFPCKGAWDWKKCLFQGQDVLEPVMKVHSEGFWIRLFIKVKSILFYEMFMSFLEVLWRGWSDSIREPRSWTWVLEMHMPKSASVYFGICFGYWMLNKAELKVLYSCSELQIVCCIWPDSTALVRLTSSTIEAAERHSTFTNSTLIFIFRRKYLLKLRFYS